MADPVVRQMAFYWQDKKAAEVNKLRVKFMSGRKELFGQDGIYAFSRGAAQMEISITEVTPIGGSSSSNDFSKFVAQADIDASWIMGGKYYRQKLAWVEAEYDSDSETGVVTGQMTLKGRMPQVTG